MSQESRMFSEAFDKSDILKGALLKSSMSKEDAEQRQKTYGVMFKNYENLCQETKNFSGMTEVPLLSNQYFNATISSYVNSFAGYLSIERAMDQPTALLWFLDLLGVTDGRKVLPNTGAEDLSGLGSKVTYSAALATGTATYAVSLAKKIIPGTLKITVVDTSASTTYHLTDDKLGNILGIPGVLSAGTINYTSGAVSVTFATTVFTVTTGDTLALVAIEDAPGNPATGGVSYYGNRFKTGFNNILVATAPDMLIGESNLIALASMRKAIGVNPQDVLATKLTELYTKIVNKLLVSSIVNNYTAVDSYEIDVTTATTSFTDFRSSLDLVSAGLTDVDGLLATKSIKGVKATAYVAGSVLIDYFKKLKQIGLFVENKDSSYVNDLVGFYDGVPVLRHTDLDSKTGYAVHKTTDGNLAPVMRGVFLPLTATPTIGNYNNPTQLANGVFYQEGTEPVAMELCQKFTIKNS